MDHHESNMAELEDQITSNNEMLDGVTEAETGSLEDEDRENNGGDDAAVEGDTPGTALQGIQHKFTIEHAKFSTIFNKINKKMWNAFQAGDENSFHDFLVTIRQDQDALLVKDHLGRSLVHCAVENDNKTLLKCLLNTGCDPNDLEGCGATPLTLAVINKNKAATKQLVEAHAMFEGQLFTSMPIPYVLASQLNLSEIVDLFNKQGEVDAEDVQALRKFAEMTTETEDATLISTEEKELTEEDFTRAKKGSLTGIVGDCSTCKANRSVM